MKNRRNFFRHDSPARELGRCCAEIAKTGGVLTRRLRRAEEQLGCRHEILQRFLEKSQIPNSKIWILWRSAGRLKKFCRRWVLKLVSSELLLLTCWRISAALPDFPSTLRELDSGLEEGSSSQTQTPKIAETDSQRRTNNTDSRPYDHALTDAINATNTKDDWDFKTALVGN